MDKTVVCLQPSYIPWLGYLHQMDRADIFLIYDDTQYSKGTWRARNRIKTPQGAQWLTVPVKVDGFPLIKDVEIDNHTNWEVKHLKSIRQNYSKAPYFEMYFDIFDKIYTDTWKWLVDLDTAFILALKNALGIDTDVRYASALRITGERTQRLIDMCLRLEATEFLEGAAGKTYLEGKGEEMFKANGIKLTYQEYHHPVYPQLYGDFISQLSVIDLLFNCGPASLEIIRKGA
jgi:hypothetical protein